ncbi:MAG: hypothetical protein CMJ52_04155 [Planctomycetaceae bacterium]|nr:hypothetical protein [Planctomycetaceae bacterium]
MNPLPGIHGLPLLGQTHLPAWTTCVVLLAAAVAGGWYWRRLRRGSVPRIRRRLRRASLVTGGGVLAASAAAAGFIDPDLHQLPYVLTWAVVVLGLLVLVVLALIDAFVSIRLHQRSLDRRLVRDTLRIREAMDREGVDPDRGRAVDDA